jgi:hypothetical protein
MRLTNDGKELCKLKRHFDNKHEEYHDISKKFFPNRHNDIYRLKKTMCNVIGYENVEVLETSYSVL